ncbi:monovalent cation/H+ antiporter subunit D [Microvirga massiliensis]|uniref:monovalent cation/H+ antiporter subunit D n=1 Tax=Microvirga massiliensis TaxID=1033741 RepID=UPI00062B6699|nr:monovalent cation/H+ antiporter subunit D [Microvirga massiliensis]
MGRIDHLMILPIVLPMVAGAVMLLINERHRIMKGAIDLGSVLALLGVAIALLKASDAAPAGMASEVGVYRLGDWPAPFGIVLVVDRLSALMLVLTSLLALASAVFSLARWHRAGAHFHSLFQFLLMGLNGAFLTGDLFNLFVFFELLLAASYGLVLHGSGVARVRAGLHYIAVNLSASLLFLIGVSLIYGVTGTLNMADLAVRIPEVQPGDRALLEAGAAILGIAFLVKAGMWPLSFWLPTTYSAAAAPVAAIFAIMSKVGVYVILRLWLLFFGADSGVSAEFGGSLLLSIGMATMIFGAIGVLASQDMGRLAGFSVLVSSGTVLAAIATDQVGVIGSALFYLVSSTLAISAFFLLIELVERGRDPGADVLAVTREAYGDDEEDPLMADEIGIAIPATMAVLGLCFIGCALVLAGLPPLSGFIAKFAVLTELLNPPGHEAGDSLPVTAWALLVLLILTGLMTLIAMTRAGIRAFWMPLERSVPRVRLIEIAPVIVLLLACMTLTAQAEAAMRYMQAAAGAIHARQDYVHSVLTAPGAEDVSSRSRP